MMNDKCPRCHDDIGKYPAISRTDNRTGICDKCGTREALEDYAHGSPLPQQAWKESV